MSAKISFAAVWVLLLIIPAVAAVTALFFIGKKRGKRVTVNRVISAILQCLAAACCIFALSGMRVEYYEPNAPSELVVLVDNSHTSEGRREAMNGFVKELLQVDGGHRRIAVALFGYGQKVALQMGEHDPQEGYEQYLYVLSNSPADGATDIASALKLAWDPAPGANPLISDPTRAKVLILSDGLETDGDAAAAIKSLTRDGVQVETSFFADDYIEDMSIIGVDIPRRSVFAGRDFEFTVKIKSSFAADTLLTYGERGSGDAVELPVNIKAGTQEIKVSYRFESAGFHELFLQLQTNDGTEQNDMFCTYCEVAESDKLLILEKYRGESERIWETIEGEHENLTVETMTISGAEGFTLAEFSAYSEIILCNGAQGDMSPQLQSALCDYVEKAGGGLFTVGGFERDAYNRIITEPKYRDALTEVPVRHSYTEQGLKNSVLGTMLPVTVEEYKPAVAVVFVFDLSGSMVTTGGPIHAAVAETKYVLDNVLDPRDYAGIVTLQDSYNETDPLSPVTKKEELKESITEFEDFYDFYAPTCYAPALQQAANMLALAPDNVAKKHIVLLSDGGPGDKFADYGKVMEEAGKQGITITVVSYYKRTRVIDGETYYFNHDYDVKGYEINVGNMQRLAKLGNGTLRLIPRDTRHGWEEAMREDMELDSLGDIGYNSFTPKVGEISSGALGGLTNLDLKELTLGGYFPSRPKLDDGASVPLYAEGSPLYAQWDFGAGKVGSLMTDLEGVWSSELLENETGRALINNMVSSLMRKADAFGGNSLEAAVLEQNFTTQVNVYGFEAGEDGDKLVAFVHSPGGAAPQKFDLSVASLGGNRLKFNNPQPGIYSVFILKVKAGVDISSPKIVSAEDIPADMVIEKIAAYRAFSYSKEYDGTADAYTTGQELLSALSTRRTDEGPAGKFVYDAQTVFEENGQVLRVEDMRQWLLTAAIVLYFAGIVARRFRLRLRRGKS